MSAPPIGMMISTPSTKAIASIAKNATQLSAATHATPKPSTPKPSARLSQCWPPNCTGAPWNRRNLYLPESLPNAITEPENVMAPMAAPRNSSSRLPLGMASPRASPRSSAQGSATAATAMKTAARPIMLCMNATSSGILVISTRLAMMVPAVPPTSRPSTTQPRPIGAAAIVTISAPVVTTAMVMPIMPNRLPRIDVVGCDSPFRAWMKQTLATRYSSVTRLRLIGLQPSMWCDPSCETSPACVASPGNRRTR